jgi:hypothetical protein
MLAKVVLLLAAIVALGFLAHFVHHKKRVTYLMTWYPGNTYWPARDLPDTNQFDPALKHGEPKVVLVREANGIQCYEVYYSRKLEKLLENTPSRQVSVTYLLNYRFGKPSWIEFVDTAGLGPVVGEEFGGQVGHGECF